MPRTRIGRWTLDRSDGTLTTSDQSLRLEPKVLAVLLLLVERHGDVVSHDDILRVVWADTHVAPGALARTISLLRTALGDDAYRPEYIETVPKRGYRLIAEIGAVEDPIAITDDHRPAAPLLGHRARAVAIAATAALFLIISRDRVHHTIPDNPEWQFAHDTRVGNETAFEHYTRAIQRDPQSADAHAGLATAYIFRANYLGDRDRWSLAAIESANRAMALDGHSARAANAAGMAHLHLTRLRDAEYQFRRSLDLNPRQYGTPLNLAYALMYLGEAREAQRVMRAHVQRYPTAVSYAYYAESLWDSGKLDEAVAAATAAARIEPFRREPQMLLIRYDLVSGAHDSARRRMERLLNAHPDCVLCIVDLGLIEQIAGRLDAAEARYRQARAMGAATPVPALRLAHVLTLTGRKQEAESLLRLVEQGAQQAAAAKPEAFFPRWHLAIVSSIRGDRAEALEWLHEAIRIGRRDFAWDSFEPMLHNARPLPAESAFRLR